MEGESPFNKSKTVEEPSRSGSPQKPKDKDQHNGGSQMSEQVQYRLERLFEEAGLRQDKYVTTIKEQQNKMKEQAQTYLTSLRGIKREFMRFMTEREAKLKDTWKFGGLERKAYSQQVANRPNTQVFSTRLPANESQQPRLECGIECYYYTPLLSDVLRENFPTNLILALRTIPPDKQLSIPLEILKQDEEQDNINCLLHRVPFQLLDLDGHPVRLQFPIHYQDAAISQFRYGQFQLQMTDRNGMFVYAEGMVNLSSLLMFEKERSEWLLRPVPFYSPLDGRKLGEMSIKLFNQMKMVHKGGHHKVSSNQPAPVRSKVTYQDDQSRMIQRISKFKSSSTSLLMGIGSNRRHGRADEYFEKQRDRMVIMHRQQKQLQSIQEYKQSKKEEYMSKIFNQALQQYQLNPCPIGKPTFLTFSLLAHRTKFLLKTWAQIKGSSKSSLEQYISVGIVSPNKIEDLVKHQQLHLPPHSRLDYDYDSEEGAVWAVAGSQLTIVVRVICFPPAPKLLTQIQPYYQIFLSISDQYGSQGERQQSSIQLQAPQPHSHIHIHGYAQTQSKVQIPFQDASQSSISKNLISNFPDLEYSWNQSCNTLLARFTHPAPGSRRYHLVVNDSDHIHHISSYQINLHTYAPLSTQISLAMGEVRTVKLDFIPDVKMLEGREGDKQQVRVLFVSSRREHCVVKCCSEEEMLCSVNKSYQVECRIQSFNEDLRIQRIIVHAMDLDRQIILKAWLLQINKQPPQYQQVYKLTCHRNRPLKYKFDLINPQMKNQSYRLYSSNLSIMTPPLKMIQLIGQQKTQIDLNFCVKTDSDSNDDSQHLTVVLTVTQGTIFANYLYELNVLD